MTNRERENKQRKRLNNGKSNWETEGKKETEKAMKECERKTSRERKEGGLEKERRRRQMTKREKEKTSGNTETK